MVAVVWAVLGRRATRWVVASAVTLGGMAALKIGSFALLGPWIFSPSGHTASAAIVYGGLAWVLLRPWLGRPGLGRLAPGLVAALCVAVIGWTRLALAAHSVTEVAAGAVVGGAGLVWLTQRVPAPGRIWPAIVAVPVVWGLFHGQSLGVEDGLRGLAGGQWPTRLH